MKTTKSIYEEQRTAFMRDDQYEDYIYSRLKEAEWQEIEYLNENN
ncbi:MAG: hypothetical protein Unbinned4388contig1000_51 [Prokaryotic dsDNA virus sp.]|nr:MAG: hypothetical protein Unbinned4388contig1000_51 [Prokaryotic dsDNA virus sp.]